MLPSFVSIGAVVKVAVAGALISAISAGWIGYRVGASSCAAERERAARDLVRATERVIAAESRTMEHGKKVVTQYRDRVVTIRERADQVEQKIVKAEPEMPSLTDPRCAWPEAVLAAVNEARAEVSDTRRSAREGRGGR